MNLPMILSADPTLSSHPQPVPLKNAASQVARNRIPMTGLEWNIPISFEEVA